MKTLTLASLLIAASASAQTTAPPTQAEQAVEAIIAERGIHVVHFWAPWCGNSQNEFSTGWGDLISRREDVTFTFVTIWSDDSLGESMLQEYGIPERVTRLLQLGPGPGEDRSVRDRTFLGLPVSWTPTTWVFNRRGRLAYAFNFGEVHPDELEKAIDAAAASWMHD